VYVPTLLLGCTSGVAQNGSNLLGYDAALKEISTLPSKRQNRFTK